MKIVKLNEDIVVISKEYIAYSNIETTIFVNKKGLCKIWDSFDQIIFIDEEEEIEEYEDNKNSEVNKNEKTLWLFK